MVFVGLVMAWRLAGSPTLRSPSCYEGDHGWGGSLAFAVVDDHGLVALHDGDTRVGCAEVDADDFAHMWNL